MRTGLAEEHAEVGVVKKADNAQYQEYIKCKLVEWYDLAPKSDQHAPGQEERGNEDEDGGEGGGGQAGPAFDSNRVAFEPARGCN